MPGEAGHVVGDWMVENHLDLTCAGLSTAERLVRALWFRLGGGGLFRLWQDWIRVVVVGTERPDPGKKLKGEEARRDGLTVFGIDQVGEEGEELKVSSRFLAWVTGTKGHLKGGNVYKSEGGFAILLLGFILGMGKGCKKGGL